MTHGFASVNYEGFTSHNCGGQEEEEFYGYAGEPERKKPKQNPDPRGRNSAERRNAFFTSLYRAKASRENIEKNEELLNKYGIHIQKQDAESLLPVTAGSSGNGTSSNYTGQGFVEEPQAVTLRDFTLSLRGHHRLVFDSEDARVWLGSAVWPFLLEIESYIPDASPHGVKKPEVLEARDADEDGADEDDADEDDADEDDADIQFKKSKIFSQHLYGALLTNFHDDEENRRALRVRFATVSFHGPIMHWLDLTVAKSVMSAARQKYRQSHMFALLADSDKGNVTRALFQAELDVWVACEGAGNKLPPETWFARGFEGVGSQRKQPSDKISLDEAA